MPKNQTLKRKQEGFEGGGGGGGGNIETKTVNQTGGGGGGEGGCRRRGIPTEKNIRLFFFVLKLYIKFQVPGSSGSLVLTQKQNG